MILILFPDDLLLGIIQMIRWGGTLGTLRQVLPLDEWAKAGFSSWNETRLTDWWFGT
jgi:hypothetical protein